jgi:hypothetical protein
MRSLIFSLWLTTTATTTHAFSLRTRELLAPRTHSAYSVHRSLHTLNAAYKGGNGRASQPARTKKQLGRTTQRPPPGNHEWRERAIVDLLSSKAGTLVKGKWHQAVSILKASNESPLRMEALLKRLVEERRAGNMEVHLEVGLYNLVLEAWADGSVGGVTASQRAREILVSLQESYEADGADADASLKPNADSFDIVLILVCRREGAIIARRLLAWMEYLDKSGKNSAAKPNLKHYVMVLHAYANSDQDNAGRLAEAFLRHMKKTAGVEPNTLCYNIAIKAYNRLLQKGRESAENAQRILDEMTAAPDMVTYSSVISAWADSGMKAHAVSRVEAILRAMEENGQMEANSVVLNAVMSAWVKSRNPAAVDRTEEILRQMELSVTAPADQQSYNTHIHALSIHSNRNPEYAGRADALLQKLEQGCDSKQVNFGPNTFSYNLVIEAYCRSQTSNSAQLAALVLRRLVKRDGVEPNTFSFNQVLSTLSKSANVKGAAKAAEKLLVYMENAYKAGIHPSAKPDPMSYSSVTVAYARSGEKGAAERAERLLQRMSDRFLSGESDVKPSRVCYNALIDCWAKSGEGTLGARKAEAILQSMQDQFDAGDESMAPNLISFNSVLNAWARSGTRCCGRKAETYLNQMWELYRAGDKSVKPNDLSYNTVSCLSSESRANFFGIL